MALVVNLQKVPTDEVVFVTGSNVPVLKLVYPVGFVLRARPTRSPFGFKLVRTFSIRPFGPTRVAVSFDLENTKSPVPSVGTAL